MQDAAHIAFRKPAGFGDFTVAQPCAVFQGNQVVLPFRQLQQQALQKRFVLLLLENLFDINRCGPLLIVQDRLELFFSGLVSTQVFP